LNRAAWRSSMINPASDPEGCSSAVIAHSLNGQTHILNSSRKGFSVGKG
jgi:hypothetical protein